MLGCVSGVPAVESVWCPGVALCRFLVDNDARAERGHGGSIVIECPVEMFLGGEARVQARVPKYIQGRGCLWE